MKVQYIGDNKRLFNSTGEAYLGEETINIYLNKEVELLDADFNPITRSEISIDNLKDFLDNWERTEWW